MVLNVRVMRMVVRGGRVVMVEGVVCGDENMNEVGFGGIVRFFFLLSI